MLSLVIIRLGTDRIYYVMYALQMMSLLTYSIGKGAVKYVLVLLIFTIFSSAANLKPGSMLVVRSKTNVIKN